jgi:hypothetical protein
MNTTRLMILAAVLALAVGPAAADEQLPPAPKDHCTRTALHIHRGCDSGAVDGYWLKRGQCENLLSGEAREECLAEAREELIDQRQECREQLAVRRAVCRLLGEEAYDPQIDPQQFSSTIDNPYLPYTPGTTLVYQGQTADGFEHIEITTTDLTIEIMGVDCRVVVATEWIDGELSEITDDYFAQDAEGNVWYFGERVLEFEEGRVVSLDGAWIAGEEGAKPGIVMLAWPPELDRLYRQEFSLASAEDIARAVSLDETVTVQAGTFTGCLKTQDSSPLEMEDAEEKYYATAHGLIATVDPETGNRVELVDVIVE